MQHKNKDKDKSQSVGRTQKIHDLSWMNKRKSFISAVCLSLVCVAFSWRDDIPFLAGESGGKVADPAISEASGLIASVSNPGLFWTHNDSGDEARIFLLDDAARLRAMYYLEGTTAHDWEDIGRITKNGETYLLVGDIGDNLARRPFVTIHAFREPAVRESARAYTDTIGRAAISSYVMKYEDGPRDAEALFYDSADANLYVISKRDLRSGIYSTHLPDQPGDTLLLRKRGDLPFTFITAADMSPDGSEILIKNLLEIFYWKRLRGETTLQMLARPAQKLPYKPEPQGEAIAFPIDGSGFYTLSERALGLPAYLYFYKRR